MISDESRVPDRVQHNIPNSVAIVGVGGVGSWFALFVSEFEDVERVGLFDSDDLERSNLERTPYKRSQIGGNKAEAMKKLIKERRDIDVHAYGHLTEANKGTLNLYKLKVACCDNVDARNIVLENENGVSSGYDITEEVDHISVSEEGPIWDVDTDDGYTIDPSWSVPAVLTAILTLYQIGQDTRPINMSGAIQEFFVRGVNDKLMFHPTPQEDNIKQEDEEESGELGSLF